MKSKLKRYAGLGVLGYLLLLLGLTWAEQGAPGSAINSFWDAFWYSMVTLSTVGYGDMYPVTLPGRIIGFCFVLMSLGLLSFVVGAVVSRVGALYPLLLLRINRDKQWYAFDSADPYAQALAKDLLSNDPDCLLLFPHDRAHLLTFDSNVLLYRDTLLQAVKGKTKDCSLFFMDPKKDTENYKSALSALSMGLPVYCCTRQVPARCPEGLTLFDHNECCAREYWRTHGLSKEEATVVLMGDGSYARQLLEHGLTMNVFCGDRHVTYHVFGDWSDFRRCHPQLGATLAIDEIRPHTDCIIFHDAPWNANNSLLTEADRIIVCHDDDERNFALLSSLRRYFPVRGTVHVRAAEEIPGETVFGTTAQTCTADLILRGVLTRTARLMHGIYSDGAKSGAAPWEQLSDFLQQSNITAADHLLTKVRILLEDDSITDLTAAVCAAAYDRYLATKADRCHAYRAAEHLRWMRFHSLYNWRYAPIRDNAARLHPMLVPFADLSPDQQVKDDYAWELLEKIAAQIE